MSLAHHSEPRTKISAESRALLEIADLLDLICQTRHSSNRFDNPYGSDEDVASNQCSDAELRRELFTLLDRPEQDIWERVREIALYPSSFPGLDTPSPLGITIGDLAYGFGLGDVDCPSHDQLMEVLRWGLREYGNPARGGNILA